MCLLCCVVAIYGAVYACLSVKDLLPHHSGIQAATAAVLASSFPVMVRSDDR